MEIDTLLKDFGYAESENCLVGSRLDHAPDFGHVFRRARENAGLHAVYCIRELANGKDPNCISTVPIAYVCKASTFDQADEIHRLLWNQNVVPLAVILTPDGVRLYTGFDRQSGHSPGQQYLAAESDISLAARTLGVSASDIDSGAVWERWGARIQPQRRVEWRLLRDLRKLETVVLDEQLTDSHLLHSLIGRFVYLYYLRDRQFLSDERLSLWNLTWEQSAGKAATVSSFMQLCDELDGRLNGSVFPIPKSRIYEIGAKAVRRVAGIFAGESAAGQMHLDFGAYDFSYIPIETLSIIYEQFLHAVPTEGGSTAGREQAAYYTPIPVVNFIVDRMDELRPLQAGMRVLDPSCGSGAFLVQCYRRLIEDAWRSSPGGKKPRPAELRDLLTKHIFGIDVDGDACRVAELSLLLTLLDYVDPPDLLTQAGQEQAFRLPDLSGKNIVQGNAFDDDVRIVVSGKSKGFDWVIGNPPWKPIPSDSESEIDLPVLDWIGKNKGEKPVGGNEASEAFAWRTADFATAGSLVGLLMPAMTLFKDESLQFRQRFFTANSLAYVANFANLAEVLFAGRSRAPAAAMIFRPGGKFDSSPDGSADRIPVFSPLVANQEMTLPREPGTRLDTWSLVVDSAEVRPLTLSEIRSGDAVEWKLAAWGSSVDRRLLRRLGKLPKLGDSGLVLSEGLQLRGKPKPNSEPADSHPELAGRSVLRTKRLAGKAPFFSFPKDAIEKLASETTWVRRRGGFELPESVCRPPHVLVGAARNWAVFSNEYLIVPPRQIGIAGNSDDVALLKAITVYLNSDLCQYHQFFLSPQFGVQMQRSTLAALRELPVPKTLIGEDPVFREELAEIHDRLVAHERRTFRALEAEAGELAYAALLGEMNQKVSRAIGLTSQEQWRVTDFVHVIMGLRDGKVEGRATDAPTPDEQSEYSRALREQLDAFISDDGSVKHWTTIWTDAKQGVVQIDILGEGARGSARVADSDAQALKGFNALRQSVESRFSQWRYFNRGLKVLARNRVYLFKPMQKFHWLRSQAVADASEVIGLVIDRAGGGDES